MFKLQYRAPERPIALEDTIHEIFKKKYGLSTATFVDSLVTRSDLKSLGIIVLSLIMCRWRWDIYKQNTTSKDYVHLRTITHTQRAKDAIQYCVGTAEVA